MAILERRPGRHVTRRLAQPRPACQAKHQPDWVAEQLTVEHNRAVQDHGSDSGGYHAYDPATQTSAGVYDGGPFPAGTVVTPLDWGRIDAVLAQRVLEGDGWTGAPPTPGADRCGCGYKEE